MLKSAAVALVMLATPAWADDVVMVAKPLLKPDVKVDGPQPGQWLSCDFGERIVLTKVKPDDRFILVPDLNKLGIGYTATRVNLGPVIVQRSTVSSSRDYPSPEQNGKHSLPSQVKPYYFLID